MFRTAVVLLVVSTLAGSARAQGASSRVLLDGTCDETSHTAEGERGTDLTQRQTRFFCNAAAILTFSNVRGHTMVQFITKEAHRVQLLGFAGLLERDGVMMSVDRIYFQAEQPTEATDGLCKMFFTPERRLKDIFCAAMVDEGRRRSTAIVAFHVAGRQPR